MVAAGIAGVESPPVGLDPKLAGGFGVFVDVIFFTFAIPAAITAAAPIKPNIPPCANALQYLLCFLEFLLVAPLLLYLDLFLI